MFSFVRTPLSIFIALATGAVCIAVLSFAAISLKEERERKYVAPDSSELERFSRFPVSVNPIAKEINDDPLIDWYVHEYLSLNVDESRTEKRFGRLLSELASLPLMQQLASPLSRTLVIYPGERREEVAKHFGDILGWTVAGRETFLELVANSEPRLEDGKFFPGKYVVVKGATPEDVAKNIQARFNTEIVSRYDAKVEAQVPLRDALVIASLLEREAYDFADMRYISGVIWNRLFINMPLQLDATLQYVRGSQPYETKWWPRVVPADKFIASPFNTYEETGLPPYPIANPSLEAVVAALNPRQTDCYFYFHDEDGNFYCTPDYEAHVALLKEIYGQGQ